METASTVLQMLIHLFIFTFSLPLFLRSVKREDWIWVGLAGGFVLLTGLKIIKFYFGG